MMLTLALGGCAADDASDARDPDDSEPFPDDPFDDLGTHLQVGDCWGLEGRATQDVIPCEQPHIYEVIAVIDDFDPSPFEGLSGLDRLRAEQDARDELCEAAFFGYFGIAYEDQPRGVPMILVEDRPVYALQPELLVCSAHSGPDVESHRTEVSGSYADRGLRM